MGLEMLIMPVNSFLSKPYLLIEHPFQIEVYHSFLKYNFQDDAKKQTHNARKKKHM
jgi:hypothetical protein